ncbi:MAG: hypothetical protein U0744_03385 [Gemmataceae bacterium]
MRRVAENSGMQSVKLAELTIPGSVIELVPESVARSVVVRSISRITR